MTPPTTLVVSDQDLLPPLLTLSVVESSRHLSSSDPYTSSWYDITGEIKDVCTGDVFSVCGMNSIVYSDYLSAPDQEARANANDCECYYNPQLSTVCKQSIKDMALWVDPNA